MAPAASRSHSTKRSTGFRCSRLTVSAWCSPRTGTARWKGRRTSLSRTGSNRNPNYAIRRSRFGALALGINWALGVEAVWSSSTLLVNIQLPVGERLRTRPDPGDVGVDAVGDVRALGDAPALSHAGGLVVPLGDSGLLALPLVRRRS